MKALWIVIGAEIVLLLAELLLVQAVGQRPIAAAMITAPSSGVALLGLGLVLARIGGRALMPAVGAFIVVTAAMMRLQRERAP